MQGDQKMYVWEGWREGMAWHRELYLWITSGEDVCLSVK